jgi:putative flippase GtrA
MKKLFHHLFVEKTEHHGVEFLRSLLAGWFAFGVDWLVLELLVWLLQYPPALMKLISYPLGVFLAFFLNRHWVFPRGRMYHQKTQILLYFLGAGVGLVLTSSLIQFFGDLWPAVPLGGINALGMAVNWVWNFLYRKFIVFRSKKKEIQPEG